MPATVTMFCALTVTPLALCGGAVQGACCIFCQHKHRGVEVEATEAEVTETEAVETEAEAAVALDDSPGWDARPLIFLSPVQTGLRRELAESLTRATQAGLVSPGGSDQAQRYHPPSLSCAG